MFLFHGYSVDRSKSVRSNQKLDRSAQVTEFGLAVDERTRNNLYARRSKLTTCRSSLERRTCNHDHSPWSEVTEYLHGISLESVAV